MKAALLWKTELSDIRSVTNWNCCWRKPRFIKFRLGIIDINPVSADITTRLQYDGSQTKKKKTQE
jgi:hypothetical protein